MKLTVLRAIPLVLVPTVVCLLISGIGRFKNAKHGFDYVVGEIVWLGFLAGALTVLILVAVAVFRRVSERGAAGARA
jgi:ABC-type transport system involved in cytochrome c biogenesis permease component